MIELILMQASILIPIVLPFIFFILQALIFIPAVIIGLVAN